MNKRIATIFCGGFGIIMLIGCSQLFVSGQRHSVTDTNIEGVWRTAVTPRNCQTGNPITNQPFPGIIAFNQGGTMTGTSTAVNSVYGTWRREPGPHRYSFRSLSFRYDPAGILVGTRVISQNVTINALDGEMVTDGEFQDFDTNGNLVISGCSTATGTRF